MDDIAVRDLRAGGADHRQPHVAAHNREPLLAPPQECAKTLTETGVVRHRPEELAADIIQGHLIDDVAPVGPLG